MELFHHYHQELVNVLPIRDKKFLVDLTKRNLLSEEQSQTLKSLPTCAERASYLLDQIDVEDCSKLFNLMEESEDENITELLIKIKSEEI